MVRLVTGLCNISQNCHVAKENFWCLLGSKIWYDESDGQVATNELVRKPCRKINNTFEELLHYSRRKRRYNCDKKKGKVKRQKHFMLILELEEAYSSFKTENPCCKTCFSKFCDLKPLEEKLAHNTPHSSWLFINHENV